MPFRGVPLVLRVTLPVGQLAVPIEQVLAMPEVGETLALASPTSTRTNAYPEPYLALLALKLVGTLFMSSVTRSGRVLLVSAVTLTGTEFE